MLFQRMRGAEDCNPRKERERSQRIRGDGTQGFGKVYSFALALSASLPNNPRVTSEIERTLRRGTGTPHAKYNKGKAEGHKLEIQEILDTLSPPSSDENRDTCECAPQSAPAGPSTTATTSGSESGMSLTRLRQYCTEC